MDKLEKLTEDFAYHNTDYVETMAVLSEKPTVESDLKILEEVDFEKYELPRDLVVRITSEGVLSPVEKSLLDLAWKLRLEDDNLETYKKSIDEFVSKQGPRSGLIFAIVFLDVCPQMDWSDNSEISEEKRNKLSEDLQKYLLDKIEVGLSAIESVTESNNDRVFKDLFGITNIVSKSTTDISDPGLFNASDLEVMRTEGVPTSNDTYLSISSLVRLINMVEAIGRGKFESENPYLSLVSQKQRLVANGVSFDQ